MNSKNKIIILILCSIIVSCTQNRPAPVMLRGDNNYNKTNNRSGFSTKNMIVVRAGDNIYNIAKKYKSSIRDIIDANDLEPPYILKINSTLTLPSTKYHTVRQGDNLHKISRLYGMNINDLIKINNLSKPYNIFSGSKLRISNSSFKSKSRKAISQRNLKSTKLRVKKSKLPYKNNKFIWPIKGNVISNFGQKPGGLYNDGINIKARNSAPVQAVEDGLVAYVGNELRGYGNLIIIKHSKGWVSAYAHLEKTNVRTGSKVKQGQIIANVGSTGNVKSSQLYFGIRKGRQAVNPKLYLN
ncbi:M23 family metallopeptidase [Rickettsiales bacterium]|nr:M23 family metallopeptidase [Rickettsiales bacterium]